MKHIIKLGVVACSILAVQTNATASDTTHWTGFYAGAATGLTKFNENHKLAFDSDIVDDTETRYNYSSTGGDTKAPNAILYVGYGKKWDPVSVYMSGEINVDFTNYTNKINTNDLTISSKRQTVFNFDWHIGYVFKNSFLVYGLVGLSNTTFNRKINFIPGGKYNTEDDGYLTLNNINKSYVSYGPQVGLGIAKSIGDHFNIRLEYAATFYNSDSANITDYIYEYLDDIGAYRFDTNTQAVNLGISYTF